MEVESECFISRISVPYYGTMKSLHRALRILEVFIESDEELGVSEISRKTSLSKSTVVRMLKAFERFNYLAQTPTRKYKLGSSAIRLGGMALQKNQLRIAARPTLEQLATQCGETVLLTALNEQKTHALCIERIESKRRIRLSVEVGQVLYLHAGASAKPLLAHLTDDEVDKLISAIGLPRISKNTLTDPELLREELRVIRERGFAESVEETDEGAAGVGAPILAEHGELLGAIAIAGPTDRMRRQRDDNVERVMEAVDQIATAMGGRRRAVKSHE